MYLGLCMEICTYVLVLLLSESIKVEVQYSGVYYSPAQDELNFPFFRPTVPAFLYLFDRLLAVKRPPTGPFLELRSCKYRGSCEDLTTTVFSTVASNDEATHFARLSVVFSFVFFYATYLLIIANACAGTSSSQTRPYLLCYLIV